MPMARARYAMLSQPPGEKTQAPECEATWCEQRLPPHSTVTDFARLRGLSTSVPRATAV
jgi:hypothetical protein